MLAAAHSDLMIAEYTPLQVKMAVTGYGRAGKEQVAYMVRTLLGLAEVPKPDDVTDALAICLCHSYNSHNWGDRSDRIVEGSLVDVQAKSVVIDVGGIGYEVMVTAAVLRLLPPLMEELFIHTYLHVQDDAMVLYGFSSLEERSLFREIISISGIGPKKRSGCSPVLGPVNLSGLSRNGSSVF